MDMSVLSRQLVPHPERTHLVQYNSLVYQTVPDHELCKFWYRVKIMLTKMHAHTHTHTHTNWWTQTHLFGSFLPQSPRQLSNIVIHYSSSYVMGKLVLFPISFPATAISRHWSSVALAPAKSTTCNPPGVVSQLSHSMAHSWASSVEYHLLVASAIRAEGTDLRSYTCMYICNN